MSSSPSVAEIDGGGDAKVRSPVMIARAAVSLLLLFGVLLGVVLVAGAVLEWTPAWRAFRGPVLGFLVGLFGAVLFWAGARFSLSGDMRKDSEATTDLRKVGEAGSSVSQEEAKRWLQKFLEEQQQKGQGE